MNISATELKNRLGKYLDLSHQSPVVIEKMKRESHVLMSKNRYDELCQLEKLWRLKNASERESFEC